MEILYDAEQSVVVAGLNNAQAEDVFEVKQNKEWQSHGTHKLAKHVGGTLSRQRKSKCMGDGIMNGVICDVNEGFCRWFAVTSCLREAYRMLCMSRSGCTVSGHQACWTRITGLVHQQTERR